jgi:hypothetical protein
MNMETKFRLLRADEIDVRIGNTNRDKTKANLLLYKDARCDMNVLDETVGPFNWQRSHNRDNANCVVSIWDDEKHQWISKEDTGTESKTEAEKGLASDSFKRACFNWGIGRELYSAPSIWVPYDKDKYESYTVAEIGYNEKREISKLAIANKAGAIIFRFGSTTAKNEPPKVEPAPDDVQPVKKPVPYKPAFDVMPMIKAYCEQNELTGNEFTRLRNTCIEMGNLPRIPYNAMDEQQALKMLEIITLFRLSEARSA